MLQALTQKLSSLRSKYLDSPLNILSTRENVMIIQIHPKRRVISVSYKKNIKTAQFDDNAIHNMLHGGLEFEQNTFTVLGAVARLIAQIINYKE